MTEVARLIRFKNSDRRGRFCTIAMGTSYGGGQKVSAHSSSPLLALIAIHSALVLCATLSGIKWR